jgi:hypothetical protein
VKSHLKNACGSIFLLQYSFRRIELLFIINDIIKSV